MERELQTIFQRILAEYINPPTNFTVPSQVPAPVPVQVPNQAPSQVPVPNQVPNQVPTQVPVPAPFTAGNSPPLSTSRLTDSQRNQHIVDATMLLMEDYRHIMRGYNDNIYTLSSILRDCIIPMPTNPPRQPTRRQERSFNRSSTTRTTESNPIYTNTTTQQHPTYGSTNFPYTGSRTQNSIPIFTYLFTTERTGQTYDDVVVRPTQNQIDNATERITYSIEDNHTSISCPITLEEFQEGDALCRIKHCAHLFREQSINDWFRSNVRCPVCRYDIRTYGVDLSSNPVFPRAPSTTTARSGLDQSIDDVLNNFTQNLSNSMMDFMQGYDQTQYMVDGSGNTLDIPMEDEAFVD